MKNYNFILILALVAASACSASAQRNYVVIYDKIGDTFAYQEMVYNKGRMSPVTIKKPKVEHGDLVTFRVINMNNFVFDVQVESRKLEKKKLTANPIISSMLGFAPLLSGISGGLNQATDVLDDLNDSRSVKPAPEPAMEQAYIKMDEIDSEIEETVNSTKQVLSTASLLTSTELTLDEMRTAYVNAGIAKEQSRINSLREELTKHYTDFDSEQVKSSDAARKRWNSIEQRYEKYSAFMEKQEPLLKVDYNEILKNTDFTREIEKQVILTDEYEPSKYGAIEYFLNFNTFNKSTIDTLPHIDAEGNLNESATKLVMSRRVELGIKGAFSPTWAAGVYFTAPFSGRSNYSEERSEFGDSLRINATSGAWAQASVGTHILFEFQSNSRWVPHASLGASLGFGQNDDKFINFMLGGGVRPAKLRFLSINGGLSFSQVKDPAKGIDTDVWIPMPSVNEYYRTVYKPGAYLGLHFHF